jgi:hypothetical protein
MVQILAHELHGAVVLVVQTHRVVRLVVLVVVQVVTMDHKDLVVQETDKLDRVHLPVHLLLREILVV